MINVSWSNMFRNVEVLKDSFDISDFAICQSTLQEAFIAITRKITLNDK